MLSLGLMFGFEVGLYALAIMILPLATAKVRRILSVVDGSFVGLGQL